MFLGCQIGPSKNFLKFKVCLGSSKFKIDFFSSCNLKRKKKKTYFSLIAQKSSNDIKTKL